MTLLKRAIQLLATNVRGHGPSGRYTRPALTQWAQRIKSWKRQGCDVYDYFDNDQKSAAPADALKLKEML